MQNQVLRVSNHLVKAVVTNACFMFAVRSVNQKLIAMFNFVLTVIGSFVFAYKAVEYSLQKPSFEMVRLLHGVVCIIEGTRTFVLLKELVRYYIEHGSCMYVTYLDASKAFDRVNHQKLFSKLIEASAPRWCVRILCHWYCNQSLCVRWESVLSEFFPVNNGVRLNREELCHLYYLICM